MGRACRQPANGESVSPTGQWDAPFVFSLDEAFAFVDLSTMIAAVLTD